MPDTHNTPWRLGPRYRNAQEIVDAAGGLVADVVLDPGKEDIGVRRAHLIVGAVNALALLLGPESLAKWLDQFQGRESCPQPTQTPTPSAS